MAEAGVFAGRNWMWPMLLAVLLAGAAVARPQKLASTAGEASGPTGSTSGSIAGRLSDLRSRPLAGATVVVRNEATGLETRTTTAKNGSYRLRGLVAGEYTLEAESPQLGHGRLEGIHVAGGGYEARVEAAMAFEPVSSPEAA